jgi:hypothetical protein
VSSIITHSPLAWTSGERTTETQLSLCSVHATR